MEEMLQIIQIFILNSQALMRVSSGGSLTLYFRGEGFGI